MVGLTFSVGDTTPQFTSSIEQDDQSVIWLGKHVVLVTLHHGLQVVLSKTIRVSQGWVNM